LLALIEGEAVALAANMITQEELELLDRSLEGMARENEAGDLALPPRFLNTQ
jgi:DNA-binding GntR family transcriptional regulator